MTKNPSPSPARFIDRLHATTAAHPHLAPINGTTFAADRDVVLAKATSLIGYQQFLADARTAKAQRKGASQSFERHIQAQGRQSLSDLNECSNAALRMTQQMNHTDMWPQCFDRMHAALRDGGPVSAKQLWSELQADERYRSTLRSQGLSDSVATLITDGISKIDAHLVMHEGKIAVETHAPGQASPRRLTLTATPGRPTSVVDLLLRSQFDQVMSAFAAGQPAYIEAASAGHVLQCEPGNLIAFGAVAARQRVAEHVRKLEDTGLATHQGNDPTTVLVSMLIASLVIAALGAGILYLCDHPGNVDQPDFVCTAGVVMEWLALIVLGALAAIAVINGIAFLVVAGLAFQLVLHEVLTHLPQYVPPTATG